MLSNEGVVYYMLLGTMWQGGANEHASWVRVRSKRATGLPKSEESPSGSKNSLLLIPIDWRGRRRRTKTTTLARSNYDHTRAIHYPVHP